MSKVPLKDLGTLGVAADATPHELPPAGWSDVSNIRFRDGYAERFLGHSAVFDAPAVTPYYIAPYQTSSKKYWIHAGTASVYADDGVTRSNITGTTPTGASTDRWTGGTLNGVFVLNNGVDIPTYWAGTGTLGALTAWSANWRAASIRPFKNFLIALDVTKTGVRYPHMVKWSHGADPGTLPISWDEADASKDAGEQDLAETPDLMVDGLEMGDVFIVYKQRSMYSMVYQGQPFIWRFQKLPGSYGMLARGCAANTPVGHVVLTAGDVIVHQGQGAKSILTQRMRRWLFTQLDSTNYALSFVVTNPWRNEVWICFPQAGQTSCTKALVWNWVDDTFGVRDLDQVTYGAVGQMDYSSLNTWADSATWASDVSGWDYDEFNAAEARLLLSSKSPAIHAVDVGATFSGVGVNAKLERIGITLDSPEKVKLVSAIYPKISGTTGTVVNVQIGASMTADGSVEWAQAIPFTIGTDFKCDTFASGRFLAVRFTSDSLAPWRIKSYDLEAQEVGDY